MHIAVAIEIHEVNNFGVYVMFSDYIYEDEQLCRRYASSHYLTIL